MKVKLGESMPEGEFKQQIQDNVVVWGRQEVFKNRHDAL
jgi:hypothetical protein